MNKQILFTNDVATSLDIITANINPSNVVILLDTNTDFLILPKLRNCTTIAKAKKIVCKSGDINKNLDSLSHIWKSMVEADINRKSLLINIGGGVVTDLGGFAAATFKRGIDYINIPTTLLGAIDASVGGKTGINFLGLKNEIGAFKTPIHTIISSCFFPTLHKEEILSGYAEMIKHAFLKDTKTIERLLAYDIHALQLDSLLPLMKESIEIKDRIVTKDPTESGLRKTLNFGHTSGHAFESFAMQKRSPIPHGYAVAYGLIVESILCNIRYKFPSDILHKTAQFVKENYGSMPITCNDYPTLIKLMHHDKKNNGNGINFTLLKSPGKPIIDCTISEAEINEALDIFRDLTQ